MIDVVVENCAAGDVHRDMVMACWMWGPANGEAKWEIEKFGTTVEELQRFKSWLRERGCRQVVLESTGVYWEPVFNIIAEEWEEQQRWRRVQQERELSEPEQRLLEELEQTAIEVTLANPREVKNRRGHKTDKKDAWWRPTGSARG